MFRVFKDFVKIFTWEEFEMLDWIKFAGGKDWGDGNEEVWVRISAIEVLSKHPMNENETIVNTTDVQVEVKGTPEKIMEMINARTGT